MEGRITKQFGEWSDNMATSNTKKTNQKTKEANQKRTPTSKSLVTLLFLIYLASLFYITFFAWNYGSSYGPVSTDGRNLNVVPLLSIHNIYYYSPDLTNPIRILLGNVIMFIPFGFLLPLVYKRWRRSYLGILPVAFLAMMLSIFIEVNQYFFTFRVANVDDVILNTLGGFIGAIIYAIGSKLHLLYIKITG